VGVFFNVEHIQYIGRVNKVNPSLYTFDWPGVQIITDIEGSNELSVIFQDTPSTEAYWGDTIYYEVFVDNVSAFVVNSTGTSKKIYAYPRQLTTSKHAVKIVRRVEPAFGTSGFVGLVLSSGTKLSLTTRPQKRIEIIGDSITCGWGNTGSAPCQNQPYSEDNLKAYGSLTASILGAEYFIEAWSGQGMVRYYGCPNTTCSGSFPDLYPQTLGSSKQPPWNFSWVPQVVVINLGTNDYGISTPHPPTDVFVQGYLKFVTSQIIPNYGKNVTVFVVCDYIGVQCSNPQAAYNELKSNGINAYFASFQHIPFDNQDIGCDDHPGVPLHQKYADYLAPIIKRTMGW